MDSRGGYHWTGPLTDTAQYSYNRRRGWAYDAAGRTTSDTWEHTYDAAGQKTKSQKQSLRPAPTRGPDAFDSEDVRIEQAYDGAGASVGRVVTTRHSDEAGEDPAEVETERALRSTVLGGAAAYELNDTGPVVKVYAEGEELVRNGEFRRADPLTGAWVQVGQRREPDPLGAEAGGWNPYVSPEPPYDPLDPTGSGAFKEAGDISDIRGGCVLDSMPVPCSFLRRQMESGATALEYTTYGPGGVRIEQRAIVSLGLGLFGTEEPYLRPDDERKADDPLFRLDWRNLVFSFQPQNPVPQPLPTPTPERPWWNDKYHQPRDACAAMADFAATLGRNMVQQYGKTRKAAEQFDYYFSEFYLGNSGIGKTYASAEEFARKPVRPDQNAVLGDVGFQEIFQDGEGDQTHHFAAHLSAGINDQLAAHRAQKTFFDTFNGPDRLLGNAAYEIGQALRRDAEGLLYVGNRIRRDICAPKK